MPNVDHDPREPQTFGEAPDPVALAGRWTHEPHPLFPRDDGSPEDRDIEYVTFRRRRTGDGLVQNYPEDIPARDVQSWTQVVLWWGGGDYKAIGKNAKHQIQACYPAATDAWESFDGESKPFTLRDGSPYAPLAAGGAPTPARSPVDVVPARAALAPPAGTTALNAIEGVLGTMNEMLREMRALRVPTTAPQGGNDAMVAMMNNQTTLQAAQIKADAEVRAAQIKADADARAAQAKSDADARAAQAQATAENNKFLLGVMTRGGGGEEKLANLLALLKPYLQPPASAAPQQDVLGLLERARDLFPQSAPAAANEIKPLADIFGSFMTQSLAADAKKAEAAADLRKAEIQAGRASEVQTQRRDREPPPLVHVTGLGMVHVVAPEATLTYAPAPAAPAVPAPAPAAPAVPAPAAPAVPTPAAPAVPAPAAPAVPAPAAPAVPAPAAPAVPAPALPLEAPVGSEAPVAPSGPTEPATPSDQPAATPLAPQAEPPRAVVADPPVVAVEMPAEVRTVLQQVVHDVADDNRAELTGKLGRMEGMSLADRASMLQRIWPLMSSKEAEEAAEMLSHLPMLEIHRMVSQLKPEVVARANVLNGTRDPGS